jgi:hypothetical protein
MPAWKLAIVIFIMLSVVFAGAGVIVITSVPKLYDQAMRLIPMIAAAGFALAAVISYFVARAILNPARG